MAIDFKIDTVTVTNQPSFVDYKPITAVTSQMIDGSYTASKRTYGQVIKVIWGVDLAVNAVVAELRTKRNSLIEHTIAFTDVSGVTHTIDVLWDSDPAFKITTSYDYEPIEITFLQRG